MASEVQLTSDLKSAALITLVSICILRTTVILVASETLAALEALEVNLNSYLKSETLIPLVSMCILTLMAIFVTF